ncbi:MAG: hypothetical protein ACRDG7_07800 [Candidatus Limnocylindria bacterium]
MGLRVALEVAPKRAFASALDWPGWSRGGKTEDAALGAFLAYAPRYAAVTRRAKVTFHPPATRRGIEIAERLMGGGGTEFGVPGAAAAFEDAPISKADLERLLALLRASWATLDAVATKATGVDLAKGPRGGGRNLDEILGHVREAEVAYLGKLGARATVASMAAVHEDFAGAVSARATGSPVANPNKARSLWSPRYAVRRAAWHVLDHAWEIEDRSA